MNCTDWTDNTEVDGQYIRKISGIRTEQKTNTEIHGKTRMQMSRDSVTLRENPCSNKNIRNIRSIRTEQKTNTENHGKARMQMSRDSVTLRENPCSNKIIRKIRSIRAEFSKSIN